MLHALRIPGIKLLTLATALLIFTATNAQHMAGGRSKTDTVPPSRYRPQDPETMIENKLVELALRGPQYQASDHQIKISESQLSRAKKSWLNLLSISANYNDQTFAKQQSPAAGTTIPVYPKYFFGLTIPLGVIFNMGPEIRGAREGVEVSKKNQEELAREIKADILSKYKQYKNFGELIGLQNTIVVDQQAAFTQTEKKFKDGIISIEQYNQVNRSYNDELAKKLNLQLSQDLVKIAIEKIIGVNLETVIK
jgi:outer membrane protein TolC